MVVSQARASVIHVGVSKKAFLSEQQIGISFELESTNCLIFLEGG